MSSVETAARSGLRPLQIIPDVLEHPDGSALVRWGRTQVLCCVSVEDKVPGWMGESLSGWVTAEYSMLPAATTPRGARERQRVSGRTLEIGRLVGRSLRAAVDLDRLGRRTLRVDCDVLQADGGTRCASITGAYVALVRCLERLRERGQLADVPIAHRIVAVSAGLVDGRPVLDLDYELDHAASVDANFVLTDDARIIEIQGTAEGAPYSFEELEVLGGLARSAIHALVAAQDAALKGGAAAEGRWP